ncbi:MAG TPA: FHA domain-containing protein [Gemmataceae bacterium]|nr:FHA domain-containing protein [Gemmataceae bacterium]
MPAQLLALTDGPSIVLDKPILLLGRHPECDIQIESRKVSRRHCCIAQVADYLVVRDLDSTNGIRINGARVQEGKLHHGDELTIGNNRYQVSWSDAAPQPQASLLKRELAPVAPVVDPNDDDELLEACENPVPLAEPVGLKLPVAPRLAKPLKPPPPPEPAPEALILPDDIPLAPASGSHSGH